MDIMKYVVWHPWKFRNVPLAFFAGFLQTSIAFIIEVANIYIVFTIGESQFDIIADFVIMKIIGDFDNFFF